MTTSVYEKIKATDRLPTPNGVALELLRLADAENTTAATITPVVESDPAIASRLVRLANHSFGGQSRKITSVQQAVTLKSLVVRGSRRCCSRNGYDARTRIPAGGAL